MASACTIPKLNTARYSSPIPVIGLYIAAGSSVCLLLMLFDIISAYRRRQSWIPCRFFKLNSFSLTMLAIASKLQVDLTTPMPGVSDQLSKLTGTTLLCICMGFLNLSVGNNGDSEYLSNMASLSIMIITVMVNICIQFYTGVIYLFIPEHIIMIFCMLVVLILMWYCASETKHRNLSDLKFVTEPMNHPRFGKMGLLGRLKACYVIGFNKNPQLRACSDIGNLVLVPFCLICCCVLVEAIVRSVVLKQLQFCRGASDYVWSTWFILATQNLTIFLGCFAIFFRWFTSIPFLHFGRDLAQYEEEKELMESKFIAIFGSPSCYKLGIHLQTSLYLLVLFLSVVVLLLPLLLFQFFGGKIHEGEKLSTSVKEFIGQLYGCEYEELFLYNNQYPCNWTMEKVMIDIAKCIEESRSGSPKELLKLFSRISPSLQLPNFAPIDDMASPLPLAVLVKTAITCIPEEASTKTLVLCFHEAIDILQTFINPKDPRYKVFIRNPLMVDEDFDRGLRLAIDEHRPGRNGLRNKDYLGRISHYLYLVNGLKLHTEVVDEIRNRWNDTREDLYAVIEQLFVDMLHSSFAELPNAIFKLATKCPMDEYKERVRPALVTLLKIIPLEVYVKWSFPENSGISSLKPFETSAADDQNNQTEGDSDTNTSPPPREDNMAEVDITSRSTHDRVALEIEEL